MAGDDYTKTERTFLLFENNRVLLYSHTGNDCLWLLVKKRDGDLSVNDVFNALVNASGVSGRVDKVTFPVAARLLAVGNSVHFFIVYKL